MKSEEAKERLVLQHHQVYNSISTKIIPRYTRAATYTAGGIVPAFYPGNK